MIQFSFAGSVLFFEALTLTMSLWSEEAMEEPESFPTVHTLTFLPSPIVHLLLPSEGIKAPEFLYFFLLLPTKLAAQQRIRSLLPALYHMLLKIFRFDFGITNGT